MLILRAAHPRSLPAPFVDRQRYVDAMGCGKRRKCSAQARRWRVRAGEGMNDERKWHTASGRWPKLVGRGLCDTEAGLWPSAGRMKRQIPEARQDLGLLLTRRALSSAVNVDDVGGREPVADMFQSARRVQTVGAATGIRLLRALAGWPSSALASPVCGPYHVLLLQAARPPPDSVVSGWERRERVFQVGVDARQSGSIQEASSRGLDARCTPP